ncbi:exportin-2 [Adelges cooleyi]|uniref:exportin-2 n=1 Tax=Adelges cooleyi TaxID=133065 RepID=UPI002180668D|nr:exportin-2 [Adelges cooleyi]XP_050434824.1 exportin-2 [Adelges cooleyi]XP_050434825.1 exportin-2 [Adelges cooleyi]
MDITPENINHLVKCLQATLSPEPTERKQAENFLLSIECNKNYPLLLLHIISASNDMNVELVRKIGAVTFKNYIKRNWPVDEETLENKIHQDDRVLIKEQIVTIMLNSPEAIQKQLSDAISLIGKHDFPDNWPNLLQKIIENFMAFAAAPTGDLTPINGALETAHSLFRKYRYELKSQKLWTEIKFVLDTLAKPLTELFVLTMNLCEVSKDPKLYNVILLLTKIFYSLNYQDLPEFFEDNMQTWIGNFQKLLELEIKELETNSDDETGILHQIQSQICENISLYAQKYEEEFSAYMKDLVTIIWKLLIKTGSEPKYDTLVINALQFLSTTVVKPQYNELFNDPSVFSAICEKVAIPNMQFKASDEELFEDNPEEYIRRDIEGSDVDTRRRAACDLVKALSKEFEQITMSSFGLYVKSMLEQYAANEQNWRSKDAALFLVTTLASRGSTQRHGTTKISELVNLEEFTTLHVLPELANPNINGMPVMKADAIKYVVTFRSVLPPQVVISTLPALTKLLEAESVVVRIYAAAAIDKILLLKHPETKALVVNAAILAPFAEQLIKSLFGILTKPGSEENSHTMKAIMRTFFTLKQQIIPLLAELLPVLTDKLIVVARNPSQPEFNHFLFETISYCVKLVCTVTPEGVASFEGVLFPIFQIILQQDILEFMPYTFQLLAQLLEFHSSGDVGEAYTILYPFLLTPALWEKTSNIHPLVRLLRSYVGKTAPTNFEKSLNINGLLGVFQKLIASKSQDHEGFRLLKTILEHCPVETIQPQLKNIFILLFQRLSSSKTTKFVRELIAFIFFCVIKYGATSIVDLIDSVQNGMFGMLLEKIILPDAQKVTGNVNKKVTGVGIVKVLSDTPKLIDGPYAQFWSRLLESVICLFELPEDETVYSEDRLLQDDNDNSYEAGYSQLAFASEVEYDPLSGVDPKSFLAQSLTKLMSQIPGRVPLLINQGLAEEKRVQIQNYLVSINVQIV